MKLAILLFGCWLVDGVTAMNFPEASYSMNFELAVVEDVGPVDFV